MNKTEDVSKVAEMLMRLFPDIKVHCGFLIIAIDGDTVELSSHSISQRNEMAEFGDFMFSIFKEKENVEKLYLKLEELGVISKVKIQWI